MFSMLTLKGNAFPVVGFANAPLMMVAASSELKRSRPRSWMKSAASRRVTTPSLFASNATRCFMRPVGWGRVALMLVIDGSVRVTRGLSPPDTCADVVTDRGVSVERRGPGHDVRGYAANVCRVGFSTRH